VIYAQKKPSVRGIRTGGKSMADPGASSAAKILPKT